MSREAVPERRVVVGRILETCLYSADLEQAKRFYTNLFGFAVMASNERICALDAGESSVLLLFARGGSTAPIETPGGVVPPHDGSGASHLAFAIAEDQYGAWRAELESRGVAVESEVQWPAGGRSLYFRDPDQNLVELATPGVWPNYTGTTL